MKARGATVPLSAGFFEIWRNRERRAEIRVSGEDGIGGPGGWAVPFEDNGSVVGLRSGLRRPCEVVGDGVGIDIVADTGLWGGMGDGSGYWNNSSRKGLQKYKACRTELA